MKLYLVFCFITSTAAWLVNKSLIAGTKTCNRIDSYRSVRSRRSEGRYYEGGTCHVKRRCLSSVRNQQSRVSASPDGLQESTDTLTPQSPFATKRNRQVRRLQKNGRLPVWPVWNGVFIWVVEKLFGFEVAADLEDKVTGRVCPNFFDYSETSPFVMLVHHCHSFSTLDPLRYLQRTFFPEGFPAHPHRGFITVTYFLDGGFTHRDSIGVRQSYGTSSEEKDGQLVGSGKHTQWLYTGRGILHEEMFDNKEISLWKRHELYQLWLNVPAQQKLMDPMTLLLGGPDETPLVVDNDASQTLVLAGTWNGYTSAAPLVSDVCILHVQIAPGKTWTYRDIPPSFQTLMLYVRKGSGLQCVEFTGNRDIPVHHMAYMEARGDQLVLYNKDSSNVVDFLLLAGEPLREPFYASGSMVMSTPSEINQAYADYERGFFGIPWDHKISDDEWMKHVQSTSPRRTKM